MSGKVLMFQGASSSVGKSLLVTALCRIYARRGWRVAPFKAQNMSNNAAVCAGGEIGRAQAVQAQAASVEAIVEMNPILLKPAADQRSQVVVRGQVWRTLPAVEYYRHKSELWQTVTTSLDTLRRQYELVLVEGAGSPAELNLRRSDIVNMAVARYARAPVLLVGDIDRGGIFAQLLGTLWLLEPEEQSLLRGFIVNKFRGDAALFTKGESILQARSGLPVLGVVPYLHDHGIAQEDAVVLEQSSNDQLPRTNYQLDIAIIRLPRISNFDDFDPLVLEPGVRVRYVDRPQALGQPDAIILPGTKGTIADLAWLHVQGLSAAIGAQARRGAAVVGICGGYQMLGSAVCDPERVESGQDTIAGLGLLPVSTTFAAHKATYRSRARIVSRAGFLSVVQGEMISGYEIHMGYTETADPLYEIVAREDERLSQPDGTASSDGRIFGVYLHGLFDNDNFRRAWLRSFEVPPTKMSFRQARAVAFDRLADAVESALDIDRLDDIIAAGG